MTQQQLLKVKNDLAFVQKSSSIKGNDSPRRPNPAIYIELLHLIYLHNITTF